jgi:hypothetical protein
MVGLTFLRVDTDDISQKSLDSLLEDSQSYSVPPAPLFRPLSWPAGF